MPVAASDLPLEERLCLALYQTSHAMDAAYRALLEQHGLTYPQYTVLSVLRQHGPTPVTGIARQLGLSTNTVSPLLKRLEQHGWISRRRSEQDERTVLVDLTSEGRRLCRAVADVPRHISAATGLSEPEQTDLVDRLHRLTAALRSHGV